MQSTLKAEDQLYFKRKELINKRRYIVITILLLFFQFCIAMAHFLFISNPIVTIIIHSSRLILCASILLVGCYLFIKIITNLKRYINYEYRKNRSWIIPFFVSFVVFLILICAMISVDLYLAYARA